MPRRPSRHSTLGAAAVLALVAIIGGCAAGAGKISETPSTAPVAAP
jgi:hypothetical protein